VTPNAILLDELEGLKKGIVSPQLVPTKAIIDPELMVSMPEGLTASTGMDALAHSFESYISKKANPLSDLFARESIRLIFKSLKRAFTNGRDLGARSDMALASLYGGIALSHSGTCGFMLWPIRWGRIQDPHGISNAILLHPVMKFNQPFIENRLSELATLIGLSPTTEGLPSLFLEALQNLTRRSTYHKI
jgi:alcohol dehydrogenase class IV